MDPINVLYEDDDFLAVNKPGGLLVHPYGAKGELRGAGAGETLTDWLRVNRPEVESVGDAPDVRPGIVHRLDKDTSGVMIIPKTQPAFDYFKSLFAGREITKIYIAKVRGHFQNKEGVIDLPIGIRNGTVKRTVHGGRMVKPAETHYKVIREMGEDEGEGASEPFTILEVAPKTGRTHQIRVHLAATGHPIVGDVIYGDKRERASAKERADKQSLALHAKSLEFTAPSGKRMKIEATDPAWVL
jgi:23S rRNA pseudouridine1911/1915/1917 synthase